MDSAEFEVIFNAVNADVTDTLVRKAREYATGGDRMHNFNISAALNGETPEQALWGFLTKHIVSVRDMVLSGNSYPEEVWDEKLGDFLVYGYLLRALVVDTGRATPPRNTFEIE